MAIITYTEEILTPQEAYLGIFPNQFVTEKEKESKTFMKTNLDYFANIAYQQYRKNKSTFSRNYDIVKGVLTPEDFYETIEQKSFMETVEKQLDLPQYVKHYSILNPPINTLMGEMSKRPDNTYVKAFDDDSKAEELQFKTDFLQKFIIAKARERINIKLAEQGIEPSEENEEEISKMTMEEVEEYMSSYTTMAERWGSHTLEALKVNLGIKEQSEEAFRDLMIVAREGFLVYEDKSERGFNSKVLNPDQVWEISTPNQKYISDPFDPYKGAYAAGTLEIQELSQIMQEHPLTLDEIKHLKKQAEQNYFLDPYNHNKINKTPGIEGIKYDVYDPIVAQERALLDAEFQEDQYHADIFSNTSLGWGNKFVVLRAYWISKVKMGKLTIINENNQPEVILVDENYKDKSHPLQLDLEWGWINQWYEGIRIGSDIYYVKPFELLEYCPIIFSKFEGKNTEPKSLVDLLKPFQTLYNIFMNKLYESLQKDWGKVVLTSIRHVPTLKDGDGQDALEAWEAEARERGVMFVDDSPENTKGASSFNQHTALDLSRAAEMQGYYNMAAQIKNEAWELVGITKARLGSVAATQTATGTNTELSQSYAQTEPWFTHHEYTMNKYYQALLDAAQHVQSKNPTSTLRYLNSEGVASFITVNQDDIKLRDLWVFVTSRSEDAQELRELKQLSQSMLQNGASPYEIVEIYTTKSRRQIKDIFKRLKKQQDEQIAQQQQLEQQQLQQQQQQFEQAQEQALQMKQADNEREDYQAQLDRLSNERIAIIKATGFGQVQSEDADGDGIQDVLEVSRLQMDQQKATTDHALKLREIESKEADIRSKLQQANQKMSIEKERIKLDRENQQNDLQIARINASSRTKAKAKSSSKKK